MPTLKNAGIALIVAGLLTTVAYADVPGADECSDYLDASRILAVFNQSLDAYSHRSDAFARRDRADVEAFEVLFAQERASVSLAKRERRSSELMKEIAAAEKRQRDLTETEIKSLRNGKNADAGQARKSREQLQARIAKLANERAELGLGANDTEPLSELPYSTRMYNAGQDAQLLGNLINNTVDATRPVISKSIEMSSSNLSACARKAFQADDLILFSFAQKHLGELDHLKGSWIQAVLSQTLSKKLPDITLGDLGEYASRRNSQARSAN